MTTAADQQRHAPVRIHARLSTGPDAPARAREALQPLRAVVDGNCSEAIELIVSELVTNSVRHAGGAPGDPVELSVHCTDQTIRVAVTDGGPGFDPGQRRSPGREPGGWGLYLVAELADRWWVESGERTRVVAEVPRRASQPGREQRRSSAEYA